MTRKTFSVFFTYNTPFLTGCISLANGYLPDSVCADSWLGMLCEYNLISHASAFSIRLHPLKVVTLFAHSTYFHFPSTCPLFFNRATDLAF